ncbi:MAG: hypothetical protein P1V20_07020 [Verrucomicrobiales bacterium]|nr:hypothetical protein [Verrucomicrobiales bacterium]
MKCPRPDTKRLLTAYVLGGATSKEVIDWATAILIDGCDSPHLRLLAGYTESQAEADLQDFRGDFLRTLEELGLDLPSERTAYQDYACIICEEILEEIIALRKGHQVLYSIWQEVNYGIGDAQIFEPFMYLEDSLSLIEEGYPPLMERFEGLNASTYPDILRSEARLFLDAHCNPKEEHVKKTRANR